MTLARRRFLLGVGAGAAGLLARPRRMGAACRSVAGGPGGPAFAGGLETRTGVNVGYWPFRVAARAGGGTWLYSGDMTGAGRRIAFLEDGVEVGLTSDLNAGSCNDRNGVTGNCASNAPRLRPPVGQWRWCYPDRFPAEGGGAVAACTSDQGWIDHNDLVFAGFGPHTIKKGPAGRDFEVFAATCDGGRAIAAHGTPSPRWGANPECNAVNACDEGEGDCGSDDGEAIFYGEDSPHVSTCLGGYEYSPQVAGGCSPDMPDGSDMPLSYLFFAPRSNTKTYLHAGDRVRVLYRKTIDIGHGDGTTTSSTWYGIEVAASQCPLLCPAGTRGWVMAWSQWDRDKAGRGLFFSEI
ncbi:MAG TPA: hypothetical protein VFU21_32110 [Kofleriaceae bacterium]|nr:hypothetical protein [Kofleriaceae bacterium]